MEHTSMSAATAARQRISLDQKAWKFIRDVNNTSILDLSRTAIEDGTKKYTYGLMFREWERYASVFSALGMTAEKHARVGVLGSTAAETIFAVYGLNMVGADISIVPSYSAFFPKKITETIRSEKLTDFIISDDFAQVNLINELLVQRKELGLNNIIVLHVPVKGVTVDPMLTMAQEFKYMHLKLSYRPICMDELLKSYGSHPVSYASEESSDTAFIIHTSGTTGGAGKPVALSDTAFNAAAACFFRMDELDLPMDDLVTAVIVDLSNAYGIVDQVHLPFAMGASVAVVPGNVLNPMFYRAIPKHGISFLFTISAMFERWMKMPEICDLDFSSLRFVILGGTAVSAADKRRYSEFLHKHGAGDVTILNGYGISELGGACCLSSPDLDDESIGYPVPGVDVRLFCEESGEFLLAKDAPCEGVLYLNSPSVATPELDGKAILKAEYVDGKPYICTNDLARLDADGRITYLGRANRYFINEDGRKYESGRVEAEFSRQSGIESCCVVPVYIKTTHDNIPMLCVKTLENAGDPKEVICRALRQMFVSEKTLAPDQIPCRVMIAEELPRNGNGKIDLYRIGRGEVEGEIFTVESVRILDKLADFKLVPYKEGPADMIKEVFDGISAEIKSNLPFNKDNTDNKKTEENEMNAAKKAVESFNEMNRMGMQMMNNMMGKMGMGQAPQMPQMPKMPQMPDMKGMMDAMVNVHEKAVGAIPGAQGMVQNMTKEMLPMMQKQMEQMMSCMQQMNKVALDTMQNMFDQNSKMINQFFEAMEATTGAPAKEEAPAEKKTAKKSAAPAKKKAAPKAPKAKRAPKAEKAPKAETAEAPEA